MFFRSKYLNLPFKDKKRWSVIVKVLGEPFTDMRSLQTKISAYCNNTSNFVFWCNFFEKATATQKSNLLSRILPGIAALCLKAPSLFPNPVPILPSGVECSINLSKIQVACLIANGFFCTFQNKNGEISKFNFLNVFGYSDKRVTVPSTCVERIKCLINYFTRIISDLSILEHMKILRVCLSKHTNTDPEKCTELVSEVGFRFGYIGEELGADHLQVDFADKHIGGLTLSNSSCVAGAYGFVQEEVLFLIYPEMIVSMLLCEPIDDKDAVIFLGPERFNKHKGYASSFEYAGPYFDTTPIAKETKIRNSYFLAIDAYPIGKRDLSQAIIIRDIVKALVGFSYPHIDKSIPVATGYWGSGAFGWSKEIKAICQIISSGMADRKIHYFIANKEDPFIEALHKFNKFLMERRITISLLYEALIKVMHVKHFHDTLDFEEIKKYL